MADSDKIIDDLRAKVEKLKDEISKSEHPKYKTNMRLPTGSAEVVLNIAETDKLVECFCNLSVLSKEFEANSKRLGVKEFKINGYLVKDFMEDIETRIGYLSIKHKRVNLTRLEAKLKDLLSPERRIQDALSEIQTELEDM